MELIPGLAGIPAAESAISYIDGQEGILRYRGYAIEELGYDKVMEYIGVDWKPYKHPDMQTDMFDSKYEVRADELD